jgi:hypothetical protein
MKELWCPICGGYGVAQVCGKCGVLRQDQHTSNAVRKPQYVWMLTSHYGRRAHGVFSSVDALKAHWASHDVEVLEEMWHGTNNVVTFKTRVHDSPFVLSRVEVDVSHDGKPKELERNTRQMRIDLHWGNPTSNGSHSPCTWLEVDGGRWTTNQHSHTKLKKEILECLEHIIEARPCE